MAEPFLGEVRITSFTVVPKGWAACDGAVLPINQNQALFALFSTQYGGDGRTTFGLPNLQGRVPIHVGDGFVQGEAGGEYAHLLSLGEMAQHTHFVVADSVGPAAQNPQSPAPNRRISPSSPGNLYGPFSNTLPMNAAAIGSVGQNIPHENKMPYLTVQMIVALQGIFPSRN